MPSPLLSRHEPFVLLSSRAATARYFSTSGREGGREGGKTGWEILYISLALGLGHPRLLGMEQQYQGEAGGGEQGGGTGAYA